MERIIGFESGELIAIALGIAGSTTIHLSQGLMRLGVGQFVPKPPIRRRFPLLANRIYAVGLALNLTAPLWIIGANRYAPTVFFTSMYAIGLVPLLVFSSIKLGERLTARRVVGSMLLALGSAIVVINAAEEPIQMDALQTWRFGVVCMIWLIGAPLLAIAVERRACVHADVVFGLLGGGFLAMDSVLKGIAQTGPEGGSFIPQSVQDWGIFVLSFVGAAGALGMTLRAHHNRYRASTLIASYDMAYVSLPMLLLSLGPLRPTPDLVSTGGIVALLLGVWLVASRMERAL